ncbi:CPBP family intramembrane metalloprotease [Candidatus Bathyarchaeota archaeon]|nr:CPBP family intramembrane metalloprotease [Candidatus Bathyarchaeota archaeon]
MKVAPIFALIFTFGTLLFLLLSSKLPSDYFSRLLCAIPFGVIVAVINGFNEEFTLRAAPISRIEKALTKNDALLITTAFFGIGHYYGVPNGVIGVLLSSFLGWFLGKSILETKGFF